MNSELFAKIDALIEESTKNLALDTIKLVNIKSVKDKPKRSAPFGKGVKKVLDTFLKMSKKSGFYTKDYNVGVVSAAMNEGEIDLGIWLHGDVVPEGDGWRFKPYSAEEYKGCIIGRGATDNKGQLVAVYHLFKIFDKLGVKLNYNPAIFVGSNEETGMLDIVGIPGNPDAKGFLNVAKPPRLSLVPDAGFPVAYGGKGGMNITLISNTALHGFSFTAGMPESPGRAEAIFDEKKITGDLSECESCIVDGKTSVSSFSPPRHGTNPDPNGNMITKLACALLDSNMVEKEDRYILEFFKNVSLDIYGKSLGIATEHDTLGALTVFSKDVYMSDGRPEITLNIRYPLGITYEKIVENIEKVTEKVGFSVVKSAPGVRPYMLNPDNNVVKVLTKVSNDVIGENKAPFTIKGGTYAHRLPNAYVFGMNGNLPPDDFPEGRGGAHGIDEAVSLERLKRAMRIYARALIELNDIDWSS